MIRLFTQRRKFELTGALNRVVPRAALRRCDVLLRAVWCAALPGAGAREPAAVAVEADRQRSLNSYEPGRRGGNRQRAAKRSLLVRPQNPHWQSPANRWCMRVSETYTVTMALAAAKRA